MIAAGVGVDGPGTAASSRRAVLVLDQVDGRSRSAVAAVRALAAAGLRPLVAVSDRRRGAAVSRDCAEVLRLPAPYAVDYRAAVERAMRDRDAVALAASDAALVSLQLPGAALVDKSALAPAARAAGLPMPPATDFPDPTALAAAADQLDYPVVVKAAVKLSAAAQARRVDSADALRTLAEQVAGPVVVQPFLAGRLSAVAGVIRDGVLLAAVHQAYVRHWPPECGVASAAVTTAPDLDLEQRLPRLLAGHQGVFQVQFVGDFLIDVNPRAYGSLPLAVAAGANLPAIACAPDPPRALVRGRPGVRYRWLEGDVRRLLHDARAGLLTWPQALTSLRPARGTAHSIESLRDPVPGLLRLWDAGRRG